MLESASRGGGCLVWGGSGPRGVGMSGLGVGGGCLVWGVSAPGCVSGPGGGWWHPSMH